MSTSTTRNQRRLATLAICMATAAAPLAAQTAGSTPPGISEPDSAQMVAAIANSRKRQHPAEQVMEWKTELVLTPEQTTRIERLILAQRDSAGIRMARMAAAMVPKGPPSASGAMGMMSWTGAVDEETVRNELCQQSKASAELIIGMIRDRHAVGELLTDAQRAKLGQLEMSSMMPGMMKP